MRAAASHSNLGKSLGDPPSSCRELSICFQLPAPSELVASARVARQFAGKLVREQARPMPQAQLRGVQAAPLSLDGRVRLSTAVSPIDSAHGP